MCGFFGGYLKNTNDIYLNNITSTLKRRGPDDYGFLIDDSLDLILAFRRLSIIDLSINGSQPMTSNSGRYHMVFNGEIYNYKELINKYKLNENYNFKSKSDTEVILACIETFGIDKTLNILDGMYAICIFDNKINQLYLITDYFSQKPIYYYFDDKNFFFSSDLSVFKKLNLDLEIDQSSKKLFFELGFIPAPKTIWKKCHKLSPNSLLVYNHKEKNLRIKNKIKNLRFNNSEKYSINDLDYCLDKSVSQTMQSDVEIGCFLSSGIDSSLVAAYMTKNSNKKINTFSIGFEEKEYSEINDIKKISNFLSTNHHELLLNHNHVIAFLENNNEIYSEPFADSSQIPTFFLSKFASEHIKVALTGDGADELFCGYNRHIFVNYFQKILKYIPSSKLYKIFYDTKLFKPYINYENKDKVEKILNSKNIIDLYAIFAGHSELFKNDLLDYLKTFEISTNDELSKLMTLDKECYLPYDILVKTDRASMYSSLECRTPYLNNEIISIAESLELKKNFRFFKGKYYLRKLLSKKLPDSLISKKKQGFAIPLSKWFKADLKNYVNNFLLKNEDFINVVTEAPGIFKTRLDEHISNKKNWSKFIWNTLIYVNFFNDK